ncbi:MAG: ATP-binding protein [Chloroflexi bacterium]|nr:ATP-binding protein [Chloroflexota bacterium]
MDEKARILVVDDDESTRRSLSLIFNKQGYETETAGTGREAMDKAERKPFHLAIIDIRLPDMDGTGLLAPLKAKYPDAALIMATAYASTETAVHALNAGASAYVTKPLNMEAVLATIKNTLERQQLLKEKRRAEEETAKRNRELAALHDALMSITQTLDLKEVLDEIVSQVGTAIGSTYASIATLNKDGSFGMISDDLPGVPPLNKRVRRQGVTRRMIATGQPVVIDDVAAETDANPFLVAAGAKSFAGLPLKAKDTVIGVLLVYGKETNAFGDKMRLLADFANQAAIAIENAKLYKEAALVGSLRETDRLKNELLANVSHELRTPLASIKGYCSYLIRYFDRLPNKEKLDALQEIDVASDKLTELVENLLQVCRLEAGGLPIQKEPVQIGPLIEQAAADMGQKVSSRRFVAHAVDTAVAVECDPRRIRQVVDNLLSNAAKFSPEGTEITISGEVKDSELVVSVQDHGMGIARDHLERVFERFYQVNPGVAGKGSGAGLGLTICRSIVERHGGRIWAESVVGRGSACH